MALLQKAPVGALLASQSINAKMGVVALLELQSFAQAVSAQRAFSALAPTTRTAAIDLASSSGVNQHNAIDAGEKLRWSRLCLSVQLQGYAGPAGTQGQLVMQLRHLHATPRASWAAGGLRPSSASLAPAVGSGDKKDKDAAPAPKAAAPTPKAEDCDTAISQYEDLRGRLHSLAKPSTMRSWDQKLKDIAVGTGSGVMAVLRFTASIPSRIQRFRAMPKEEWQAKKAGMWATVKHEAHHYWVREGGREGRPPSGGVRVGREGTRLCSRASPGCGCALPQGMHRGCTHAWRASRAPGVPARRPSWAPAGGQQAAWL